MVGGLVAREAEDHDSARAREQRIRGLVPCERRRAEREVLELSAADDVVLQAVPIVLVRHVAPIRPELTAVDGAAVRGDADRRDSIPLKFRFQLDGIAENRLQIRGNGFTVPGATAVTVAGMFISFFFLARAMKVLPLGTAYAVWTGIGAAGTVLVGIFLFKEPVTVQRIIFTLFLIIGIVGLKFSTT